MGEGARLTLRTDRKRAIPAACPHTPDHGGFARQCGLVPDTPGIAMLWIVVLVPITMIVIAIHPCSGFRLLFLHPNGDSASVPQRE